MHYMNHSSVTSISDARRRSTRVSRAIDARRRIRPAGEPRERRSGGRAWLNGVQLGDPVLELEHLADCYD